ncbi:hypothetical protein Ciccas_004829, partial [Cichlidogyrus casuarinus]
MCRTQAGWNLLAACLCVESSETQLLSKTLGQGANDVNGVSWANPCVVMGLQQIFLPRMHNLWRNAFPRSPRELDQERQKGDAFTWQVMLEARIGALTSIQAFLLFLCPGSSHFAALEAVLDENLKRILPTIECALNLVANLPSIIKTFGQHLKPHANMLRLRLYRCLSLLPPKIFTSQSFSILNAYSAVLRELVAEFTLTDCTTNTQTSLYEFYCESGSSSIVHSLHKDACYLEDQFMPNTVASNGFSALEHDPTVLFLVHDIPQMVDIPVSVHLQTFTLLKRFDLLQEPGNKGYSALFPRWPCHQEQQMTHILSRMSCKGDLTHETSYASTGLMTPWLESSPLHIAVLDCSVQLFGKIFPYVSSKHRAQMFQHFHDCIKSAKSARSDVIRSGVKSEGTKERGSESGGHPQARGAETDPAIANSVSRSNPILRGAACESLGRLCLTVGEATFLQDLTQFAFDRLRQVRDPVSRAGHCQLLGHLHQHVGGLSSSQHLDASVGLLLSLAQDSSAPAVQSCAVRALTMVADSGGPMFRQFVEPSLELVQQLFLRTPSLHSDIHRGLGRLLNSLITCLGPELQGGTARVAAVRDTCKQCCMTMRHSEDPLLEAEAVNCMHQLHIFSPEHFPLAAVIPRLERYLLHENVHLRRSTVNCLRYLSQKEAFTLSAHWEEAVSEYLPPTSTQETVQRHRLEAVLFSLLDTESDWQTRRDTEETILFLQQSLAFNQPQQWLVILKDILKVLGFEPVSNKICTPKVSSVGNDTLPEDPKKRQLRQRFLEEIEESVAVAVTAEKDENSAEEDMEDDDDAFDHIAIQSAEEESRTLKIGLAGNSRWSTQVFALGCLRRLFFLEPMQDAVPEIPDSPSTQSALLHEPLLCGIMDYNTLLMKIVKGSDGCERPSLFQELLGHLPDMIRMAFICVSKPQEHLRIAGLLFLQLIIEQFAPVPDPEYPLNSILEQHQAQVIGALRVAFQQKSAYVNTQFLTTAASVCASWLCSDVLRDQSEYKKVLQLMEQALDRLKVNSNLVMATEVTENGLDVSLDSPLVQTPIDVNSAQTLHHLSMLSTLANLALVCNTLKLSIHRLKELDSTLKTLPGTRTKPPLFTALTNKELALLHTRIAENAHEQYLVQSSLETQICISKDTSRLLIEEFGDSSGDQLLEDNPKRSAVGQFQIIVEAYVQDKPRGSQ